MADPNRFIELVQALMSALVPLTDVVNESRKHRRMGRDDRLKFMVDADNMTKALKAFTEPALELQEMFAEPVRAERVEEPRPHVNQGGRGGRFDLIEME